MAQILQIKRTNTEIKAANVAKPLDEFTDQTIAQGELFYANEGVEGIGAADEGVLYIGTAGTAGVAADAIGGKAFTKMLNPKEADDITSITQSVGGTSAASITLADAAATGSQKTMTISAPPTVADNDTVLLPGTPGGNSTSADTIITTAGDGKVGALTSSGTVTGVSLATAGGSVAADGTVTGTVLKTNAAEISNAGKASVTSVDSSGTIEGTTITGTTLATANASVNDAGALVAISANVSGDVEAGTLTVRNASDDADIATISNTGIVDANALTLDQDGSDGAITGVSTVSASGQVSAGNLTTAGSLAAGGSTLGATSVVSLDANSGGITEAGAISGATTITASGKITAGSVEIGGAVIQTNTTDVTISDSMLQLADGANPASETNDVGWFGSVHDGTGTTTNQAGMVWDQSSDKFKIFSDAGDADLTTATALDGTEVTATLVGNVEGNTAGTHTGDVQGDVTGDVTGNADTATALASNMTITLGGDLTGNVVTAGEDKTLTATIASNSVQDSMLNTDVKLSSLHDVASFAGGGADDGKVLTVKADGTLEWTSKTGGTGGGALYGVDLVAGDTGEVVLELTDDDPSNNDKVTFKQGNAVTLTLDTTSGDEMVTIASTDTQLSNAEVNAAITQSRINDLDVDAATVNGKTVAGNVGVAVPADADFDNDNTQATYSVTATANGGAPDVDINLVGGGDANGVTDTLSLASTGSATISVAGDPGSEIITVGADVDTDSTYSVSTEAGSDPMQPDAFIHLDGGGTANGAQSSIELDGAGATSISRDGSGRLTISSTDNNDNSYVSGLSLSGANVLTATMTGGAANQTVNLNELMDDTDTNTTYSTSVVDSNNDAIIRLTSGGDGAGVDDDIKIVAGALTSITPSGSDITIASTATNATWNHNALTNYDALEHQKWAADVSGQVIHVDNIAGSAGWDGAKASVDGAESSFASASAGDLVEWGNSGALTTTGTVSAGTANVTNLTNQSGNINVIPNGGSGTFTITFDNSESLTFDDGGITASGAMSLDGFTADGGVIS